MTDPQTIFRIRERIIDVLEWIVDSRTKIPDCGFNGLVNLWDDWLHPFRQTEFSQQGFSIEEIAGIRRVDELLEAFCLVMPQSIPDTQATLRKEEWVQVTVAAEQALSKLLKRSMLPI